MPEIFLQFPYNKNKLLKGFKISLIHESNGRNKDDNPDIYKYYGYGDLSLFYPYKKHTFELRIRNNIKFNSQNKGATELNWTFPLPELLSTSNSYGFLKIFSGYGESLIDYNRENNKIGIGIAFSR